MSERITVKSQSQIEKMRAAGRLVGSTLKHLETLVSVGISTYELNCEADNYIRKNGGVPSFLNYNGFPASICTSVNQQVVHGIPSKSVKLRDGDIISIDCGAIVDGYHGDAARTIPVGNVADDVKKLIQVTRECFFKGIEQAVAGNHICDISRAIQDHAQSYGYGVVRDMVGHGIGTSMHEPPEVPNYTDPRMGRGAKLYEGMTLAVEPMINMGTWRIVIASDGWNCVTADGRASAHYENTIVITKNLAEVLTLPE